MWKGVFSGVVLTLAIIVLGGYIVIKSGLIPANADTKPGSMEHWAAETSLSATLKRDAPKGPSPVLLTDQNLMHGIQLFAENCAVCHGSAKGADAASPIAKGEYPAPPQLATNGVEDDPEGYSFWKIKHGIRWTGMPSWRYSLSDQDIWTLALFLKHMDKLPPAVQQTWQQVQNWPLTSENHAVQK
ncbi:MAG: c-type cytochrome [Sulfuriferula sp.]